MLCPLEKRRGWFPLWGPTNGSIINFSKVLLINCLTVKIKGNIIILGGNGMGKKSTDTDHIWPTSEGGPEDSWNKREISPSRNRSKGSEMPSLSDVLDSDDPLRLAAEIDKHTLSHGYNTPRNKGRGFGGLKR